MIERTMKEDEASVWIRIDNSASMEVISDSGECVRKFDHDLLVCQPMPIIRHAKAETICYKWLEITKQRLTGTEGDSAVVVATSSSNALIDDAFSLTLGGLRSPGWCDAAERMYVEIVSVLHSYGLCLAQLLLQILHHLLHFHLLTFRITPCNPLPKLFFDSHRPSCQLFRCENSHDGDLICVCLCELRSIFW